MTVAELDLNYLKARCDVLNRFWDEEIDSDQALRELDQIDFQFEAIVGIESIPMVNAEIAGPYNWQDESGNF